MSARRRSRPWSSSWLKPSFLYRSSEMYATSLPAASAYRYCSQIGVNLVMNARCPGS
jgi:hypothetical protein